MSEFVASNGYTVIVNGGTIAVAEDADYARRIAYNGYHSCTFIDLAGVQAVRRYFAHEAKAQPTSELLGPKVAALPEQLQLLINDLARYEGPVRVKDLLAPWVRVRRE